MKKLFLSCVIILGISTACNKENMTTATRSGASQELNVPESFDWTVAHNVTLDLTSVEPGEVNKAVQVYSEGNLILTKRLTGADQVVVNVPKHVTTLDVVADGKLYKAAVHNGNAVARLEQMVVKKSSKCDCDGKMQNFTVVYSGPNSATVTAASKGKGNSQNVFQTFNNVNNGDTLTIIGFDKHGRLGAQTFLSVNGGSSYNVHTSCSEDILGNTYGPFFVIGYTDGQGASCSQSSNPPPPPPTSCACDGRMRNFTVIYSGANGVSVEASYKDKGNSRSISQTFNNVNDGDTLVIIGFDKHGRLKSQTFLSVNGGTSYNVHTSCSENILGKTYGPFYVIAYTDGQGVSCGLTPPPCVDTDGDGCCDADDSFPNDPSKCDEVYVPGEDVYGTVAFEDLWPYQGDFDFNDLVIDRTTTYSLDLNGDVTALEYTIVTRAAGAKQNNGFGLAFPKISNADIASVTGAENPATYTVTEPNGTEAGQDYAVVILYEDWHAIVTQNVAGGYFNTFKGNTNGDGDNDTMVVEIVFSTPQAFADVDWDPFLIRDGKRDYEIHLPSFGPTKLAENSPGFGTGDDASAHATNSPGNNYVDVGNIPWAVEVPNQSFDYVVEFKDIREVYHDFTAWANSGGTLFTDWHSNGNVDLNFIY